jgi:hypothetical protein
VQAPGHLPAAGNFTADGFRPATWKPHYPNAAFRNAQPEDLFWAARLVAAFTPEAIGRIVDKARFSDPAVVDHVTGTLLRRRELVLREWLTAVNPISNPRVDQRGILQFSNAAVDAGLAAPPRRYELSWFQFDNDAGRRSYVGSDVWTTPEGAMPGHLLRPADYAGVDIRTVHAEHAGWRTPVRVYFRRTADGWMPVGLERRPDERSERYAKR